MENENENYEDDVSFTSVSNCTSCLSPDSVSVRRAERLPLQFHIQMITQLRRHYIPFFIQSEPTCGMCDKDNRLSMFSIMFELSEGLPRCGTGKLKPELNAYAFFPAFPY
ncbi:hypothetical protein PIIN_09800 [Serendipita indica DSM 11827]|uniref:Uncharacterized protein n=1 Tax=Serendipita indica (strain DSM 11827) TaxID=1109443 RepID=G4TWW9_SERID|nr:hypothetical protein PIIN_09800 [Serendipita indica DSM 11827]